MQNYPDKIILSDNTQRSCKVIGKTRTYKSFDLSFI